MYRTDYSNKVRDDLNGAMRHLQILRNTGYPKTNPSVVAARFCIQIYLYYLQKDKARMQATFEEFKDHQIDLLNEFTDRPFSYKSDITFIDSYKNFNKVPYIGTKATHDENIRQFGFGQRRLHEHLQKFVDDLVEDEHEVVILLVNELIDQIE